MDNLDTDLLPKDKKQAVAKALLDLNYSAMEIAETLGIHRATVYRYKDKPLPPDLRQFATEIKTMFAIKQQVILAKILKNIEELADQTDDIRGLVVAFEAIKRHTPTLYEISKEQKHQEKWDDVLT